MSATPTLTFDRYVPVDLYKDKPAFDFWLDTIRSQATFQAQQQRRVISHEAPVAVVFGRFIEDGFEACPLGDAEFAHVGMAWDTVEK